MTIWERVKAALETLDAPVVESVYIAATPDELPDLYLVYFLVAGVPVQHADDREVSREQTVQVSCYSRGGLANLPDVTGAMLAAGFTAGPSRELPYNQATQHFGLALDFDYLENKE